MSELDVLVKQVNANGGMKFDTGKLRYDLFPVEALEAIVDVLTYGANKYDDENWKKVESYRYIGAMMRHFEAFRKGEKVDSESGRHHLAHAASCIIFLLSKDLQGLDD